MHPGSLNRFGRALLALGFAAGIAAAGPGQDAARLQIVEVALNGKHITITGKNFGAYAPEVKLAGESLAVIRNSETEIVAEASGLESGLYPLQLTRDATPEGTDHTSVLVP